MLWTLADRLILGQWRVRRALGHRLYGIADTASLLGRMPVALVEETLRLHGAAIGPGAVLKAPIWIDNATGDKAAAGDFSHLRIGARAFVGKGCFFDLPDRIELGEQAVLSAGVSIFTHADCGDRYMSAHYPRRRGPVTIGHGAWVAANATILHGVTVGEGAVVAAGSVVTKDVPPGKLYGGVPAKALGDVAPSQPISPR